MWLLHQLQILQEIISTCSRMAAVQISALPWSSPLGCSKTPALVSGTPPSDTTLVFPVLFLTLFIPALSACAVLPFAKHRGAGIMAAELSCSLQGPLELTVPSSLSSPRPPLSCSPTLIAEASAVSHLFCRDNYLIVIHSHSSFLLLAPVTLIIVLWTISN